MKTFLLHRFRFLLLSAALAMLAAGAGGCGRSTATAAPSRTVETPPVVETIRPTCETVAQVGEQPGQIEADEEAPLHARVSGYVKAWFVDIGDIVKKDQLLAELSVPELDQELRRKEAALLLARAETVRAERAQDAAQANVERAGAAVSQAEAVNARTEANRQRWDAEYRRARRLRPGGVITGSEFDATQDHYHTATAAMAESKAALALARAEHKARLADLAQAEANVKVALAKQRVAEADRDRLAEMVRFARITAPFDGVVTRRGIETGQLVQPPAGTPGSPLFTVVRTHRVRIMVDVPESAAVHVHKDMKADVRVGALGQRVLVGEVTRTTWALDTRTRTLRTQVELDNPEGLLRPGMFVSVRLTMKRPGTLLVPATAVYRTNDERAYVVCVENGRAVRTHVQVGERYRARVELLRKEGLSSGGPAGWVALTGKEEIIASNPAAYDDGQAVTTRPAERLAKQGD
jgi:multidrug efflux pump subunit AcrA (membrane-fusion protein)